MRTIIRNKKKRLNKRVPEIGEKIDIETGVKNIYFRSKRKAFDDIKEEMIKRSKKGIKKQSLIDKIFQCCELYGLRIIGAFKIMRDKPGVFLKDGITQARRSSQTYAFQDIYTGEVYMNIVIDESPSNFNDLEKLYLKITNFTYLKKARDYSLYIEGKKLKYFAGKIGQKEEEEGIVCINGTNMLKSKIIADVVNKRMNIIRVLIPMMYGPTSKMKIEDLMCLKDIKKLARPGPIGIDSIIFELHHILVINGGSDNKMEDKNGEKIEPSVHLLDPNLFTTTERIIDLMGTIKLSPSAHKHQHASIPGGGWGSEQGIEVYAIYELPYCLQSRSNYEEVLRHFNIVDGIDYAIFIEGMTNPNTPKKLYHKDRLILSEEAMAA